MATCTETSVPDAFADQDGYFGGRAPLSAGVGYGVVLGFGLFFSLFTIMLMKLDLKYGSKKSVDSEDFNTAGRSMKTGLTAANVASQWTWAATLLQSSNVAWQYGVSGPFWYASGASIQVMLFGILAIQLKRKAPKAHTFCEMVKARWGTTAHLTFIYFGLLTNIIVTSMLLLGGASVTSALTGMDVNVASILIPWGVIAYTMTGGMKAAFMAGYVHTVLLFVILCIFMFSIYVGPDKNVGSVERMYTLLDDVASIEDCKFGPTCQNELTACGGVPSNAGGSYLTMRSLDGLIFGIINIVGNFGTVFLDQSYWQAAIAAKPQASHKGYLYGGLCWFCIPFSLATSLGLAAVALQLPLTSSEANAGLVPAATAQAIMGKGGATLMLVMLFMAVTSSGCNEMISVASLLTYDVYRAYFKPDATGKEVLRFSQYCILGFGLFSGVLAIILNQIGLGLGWVYLFMGVAIGSGVIPIAMCVSWSKASATGAVAGAFGGQICGLIAWLVTSQSYEGAISVDALGANYPMLAGNLVSILASGAICATISIIKPQNYDWESMKNISMIEKDVAWLTNGDYDDAKLSVAKNWILKYGILLTALILVIWPVICITFSKFSLNFWYLWVAISAAWGLAATAYVTLAPLVESRHDIIRVTKGVMGCGDGSSDVQDDAMFKPDISTTTQTSALAS